MKEKLLKIIELFIFVPGEKRKEDSACIIANTKEAKK